MKGYFVVSCALAPLLASAQISTSTSQSTAPVGVVAQRQPPAQSYEVGADRKSVEITSPGSGKHRCQLRSTIEQAKLSFDQSAIIVSANGYIPTDKLNSCGDSSIKPLTIPAAAGILVDISVKNNVYIALLPVSTQPFSYLATVGRVGKLKNVISLPGAYVVRQSRTRQLQQAFSYSEDGGPSAKISLNGRYVTVDGSMDCSENAYPGVWDIKKNRRVLIIEDPYPMNEKCQLLFSAESNK